MISALPSGMPLTLYPHFRAALTAVFHRFGARVHGQCHIESGQFVQVAVEQRQLVIAERA